MAKKLGRQWMGFELSRDYVRYISERLDKTSVGDPIDGPEDPIQSAPATAAGRRQKRAFDEDTQKAVIAAYRKAGRGYPADYILCDKDLNAEFVRACRDRGIGGSAYIWNRYLLRLRKANRLPNSSKRPAHMTAEEMDRFGFASEVAWRLIAIDFRKTLDDILCSPEFAGEFDLLAAEFGPTDASVSSLQYRRAALSIRKRSNAARTTAAEKFKQWKGKNRELPRVSLDSLDQLEKPGVFVLKAGDVGFYAGESRNMRARVEQAMSNESWNGLEPDTVAFVENGGSLAEKYALKSALAHRECPLLNCRLLVHESELP